VHQHPRDLDHTQPHSAAPMRDFECPVTLRPSARRYGPRKAALACLLLGISACAAPPRTVADPDVAVLLSPTFEESLGTSAQAAVPVGAVELSTARAVAADGSSLSEVLAEASLVAIGSGFLGDSLGTPAPVSFNELRFLMGRESPERSVIDAYGLGVEVSAMLLDGIFADLGFWVLEEDAGKEREVGRLSLGVGYAESVGAATAAYGRVGLEWERGRKQSVDFFSLVYDDRTLFEGGDDELGANAEIGLRHRANSLLELATGVRGETLRKDSVGWFAEARVFLGKNLALRATFEDVDEETVTLGLVVVY